MTNIAPGRSGKLRESYVSVMADVGKAIRDTFAAPITSLTSIAANCSDPNGVVLNLPGGFAEGFDYIETKEDLRRSQRIMNYSIEYRSADTSSGWHSLGRLPRK